jgi:hypothetical protein
MAQLQPTKAIPVPKNLVLAAASIAISTTVSAAIPCNGLSLVGIQLPAAFTGTALTFQSSVDGTTYQPVYNSAGAVSYTVAQGHFIAIDPKDFYGIVYLKIVSGTSEAAARSFTALLKGF